MLITAYNNVVKHAFEFHPKFSDHPREHTADCQRVNNHGLAYLINECQGVFRTTLDVPLTLD
jgi:hypothetical protein